MTGADLINLYEFTYGSIRRNLDGVSNEESLHRPQPSGNCINWVVGHVVAARALILTLSGVTPGDQTLVARYKRGSEPISSADTPVDLATLRGLLDDTQQQLIPALAEISDDALSAPIPENLRRPPLSGSVGDALARLSQHESYHSGQIGLLRRLVGKESAIK